MHVSLVVLLKEWEFDTYNVISSGLALWILGIVCKDDDITWQVPEPLLKQMVKTIIGGLGSSYQ